jgi:hypothetical protein
MAQPRKEAVKQPQRTQRTQSGKAATEQEKQTGRLKTGTWDMSSFSCLQSSCLFLSSLSPYLLPTSSQPANNCDYCTAKKGTWESFDIHPTGGRVCLRNRLALFEFSAFSAVKLLRLG